MPQFALMRDGREASIEETFVVKAIIPLVESALQKVEVNLKD